MQLSLDGEAMVFHDETLQRMTGAPGVVSDLTAEELKALPLLGGPDRIPTLAEALELIAGRVFLLVEIKSGPEERGALESHVGHQLKRYAFDFGVISFDPSAVAWFAVNHPGWPRGLDAAGFADEDIERDPQLAQALQSLTAECDPHFLVLETKSSIGRLARAQRARGRPVVAWTVRSTEDVAAVADHVDNFIFEGFTA